MTTTHIAAIFSVWLTPLAPAFSDELISPAAARCKEGKVVTVQMVVKSSHPVKPDGKYCRLFSEKNWKNEQTFVIQLEERFLEGLGVRRCHELEGKSVLATGEVEKLMFDSTADQRLGITITRFHHIERVQSIEELNKGSTHVVVGKLRTTYTKETTSEGFVYLHGIAELVVMKAEKGEGVKEGEVLYVRYWTCWWAARSFPPPYTRGHYVPAEGKDVRVYLQREKDGTYGVLVPNGFEAIGAKR